MSCIGGILKIARKNKMKNQITKLSKNYEDWINRKWRPLMGYTYMATCITDFIIFPVLWSVLQALQDGQVNSQWDPITLKGAGLFHLAMGAILGVAAWSRGKEKIAGVNGVPYDEPMYQSRPNYYESAPFVQPRQSRDVFISSTGKAGPLQPDYPEL